MDVFVCQECYTESTTISKYSTDPASCFRLYDRKMFFQAEDGIRDGTVTGVQTCALPISRNAEHIIGLDPSPKLLLMARRHPQPDASPVKLVEGSAEAIPFGNGSGDTVGRTWTLFSIFDVERALAEIRRVLKPGGRLLFVEHGRAPEPKVRWWQDQLTPVWERLSGGRHITRAMNVLIEGAGFQLERVDTGYLRGPKPMTFMYEGSARPL